MQFLMILVLFFSIVVAIFAVQNAVLVPVQFITWHFETSLVFVILLAAALGALIIGLFGLVKGLRQGFQLKSLAAKNSRLDQEKEELEAELGQVEIELAKVKNLFNSELGTPDLEEQASIRELLSGSSLSVADSAVSLVRLPLEYEDSVRTDLGDCAGLYQLTVAETEVTLVVDANFWGTVEARYSGASVETGWRLITLGQKIPRAAGGYLQAVANTLNQGVDQFYLTGTFSGLLVLVKEDELPVAVEKLQTLFDISAGNNGPA